MAEDQFLKSLQEGWGIFRELGLKPWDDVWLAGHDGVTKAVIHANHFVKELGGHFVR